MLFEIKPKNHVKSELTYIFVLLHQLIYVVLFPQLHMSCSYGGCTLHNHLLIMYMAEWLLVPQIHTLLLSFSFKEGKVISPNNERIQIVTDKAEKGFYELVIANVLPEDAGKYSCTAKNKYGEVSCEATVTVTSKLLLILVIIAGETDDSHISLSLS